MMIEFMSLVESKHCKFFYLIILEGLSGKNYFFSKTEIWSIDENDDTVNMKIAEPNLIDYGLYPELFIVDSDFCAKK